MITTNTKLVDMSVFTKASNYYKTIKQSNYICILHNLQTSSDIT